MTAAKRLDEQPNSHGHEPRELAPPPRRPGHGAKNSQTTKDDGTFAKSPYSQTSQSQVETNQAAMSTQSSSTQPVDPSSSMQMSGYNQASKDSTNQLRQPSSLRRRWITRLRIIKYGLANFTRNAWLTTAATAVMTITLLIIFATALASGMLNNTVTVMRDKVEISVYLKSNLDEKNQSELIAKLKQDPNISDVMVISSQQNYNDYVESIKSNPDDLKIVSEIKVSFPVTFRLKVVDLDKLSSVKTLVENDAQFKEWVDPSRPQSYEGEKSSAINTISRWADFAQMIGLVLGGIFLVISMLVIFNTIRMAIFSRKEEIEMEKLIGAERKFIRGPFLVEAQLYGLIAAILATIAGYAVFNWISPFLENYGIAVLPVREYLDQWWWAIGLVMIVIGMLIGYISARLAVRKYLRN